MNELIVRWKNGETAIYRFTTKGDAVTAKMIFENHCGNEIRDIKINALEQQPSEDCISLQALLDYITANYGFCHNLIDWVRAMPPVTPQRPKGKWFETNNIAKGNYQCSICKHYADWFYKYCPNCGAEMSGGGEDADSD